MLSIVGTTVAGCSSGEPTAQPDGNAVAAAETCDRACLVQAMDAYLAALVAHDPKAAPLANDVVFVENLTRMKPGEGLWKSATGGKTDFAISVPDPELQQAGWLGMIAQNGKPAMLALRLKFHNGKIVEAEHLVAPPGANTAANVKAVRPGLLATIPEGQRLPHGELIRIGASYYDSLDDNDGSKTPYAADCQRRENGITTAGAGAMGPPNMDRKLPPVARDCKGQIDSNSFAYIDRIENRRMIAADPVTGLAMGFSHFRHPLTNLPYNVTHVDGSTSERNKKNMPYAPFDMPAAHIFKVGPEGMVHEIEAVGVMAPYNSATGWN
jgi:hypothetical protein